MRVLAVNDDAAGLEWVRELLAHMPDCEPVTAVSAHQAVALVQSAKRPFDCILIDHDLPDMPGTGLIPLIQQFPHYIDVPIIMMIDRLDHRHIIDAFVAGAFDYVTKPFAVDDLDAAIRGAELCLRAPRELRASSAPLSVQDRDPVMSFGSLSGASVQQDEKHCGFVSPLALENCITHVPADIRRGAGFALLQIDKVPGNDGSPRTEAAFINELSLHLVAELADTSSILAYLGANSFAILSFSKLQISPPPVAQRIERAVSETRQSFQMLTNAEATFRISTVNCADLPSDVEPLYVMQHARLQTQNAGHRAR
ncbi:response regulator [Sulfitobacter sp. S190]|uniref:response regulator n=1 Tax=Sulfitobacter sp. S190 TaxID=2867022 RepID=UPI0021A61B87|nr:response regulator [Sulfitobacter sp. S190]UWR23973.1 response regulator [Sulfitobacter sp. S190]